MGERERAGGSGGGGTEHRISAASSQHVPAMRVLMESDGRVLLGMGLSSSFRGVKDTKFSGEGFVSLTSAEVTNQSLEGISCV